MVLEMGAYINTNIQILKRQPWFVATLSWLYPGIGQLFIGAYWSGLAFAFFAIAFHVMFVLVCLRSEWSVLACLGLCYGGLIACSVVAVRDAYKKVRLRQDGDYPETQSTDATAYFAVFLSVLFPGLGLVYLRRWLWAIAYLFLVVLLNHLFHYYWCGKFATRVVLYTASAIHAYVIGSRDDREPKRALWPIMALVISACMLPGGLIALCQNLFFIQVSDVIGPSMTPTLLNGDRVLVDRRAYVSKDPAVGDIINFHAPNPCSENGLRPVNRIVAVGGETIELRDGQIYINGQIRDIMVGRDGEQTSNALRLMYGMAKESKSAHYAIDAPYRVPDDHYFVLGDNYPLSLDSRYYGAIPRQSIIGQIVKSWNWPQRGGYLYKRKLEEQ